MSILPVISVDISVNAPSIFRAAQEPSVIVSPVSGSIRETFVEENKFVAAGDTLFELESVAINERRHFFTAKLQEVNTRLSDLNLLLVPKNGSGSSQVLKTFVYVQAQNQFQERIREVEVKLDKARRDFDRNKGLFDNKVIAQVEFEGYQFEVVRLEKELQIVKETQRNQWASERQSLLLEKNDISGQLASIQAEASKNYILAPLGGVLTNSKGYYKGGFVLPNQELVSISPTDSIIVMAYVSPADIGFIRVDMPVTLQVDAFDYNQWGLADARIIGVSENVKVLDGKPVFEVRCQARQSYLELPNGYRGYLKQGMTAQSRFILQQRTLWQLLFDKVDDWLNPNLNS
ncbi:HlyD family efflux transporter periplasmic adaptor subunit [uncultured Imperialibacter sp.]|uniref:HlyD family secretion protein n=1 Tax=uncultured Imperialibacter sp. TaxID=1672639 RepID=UPI0030DA4F12